MYERFTDRARMVMQYANQEAHRFNHEYVGTEHILLGLVIEGTGVAANVLKNLDIDLRKVRLEVEKIVQAGPDMVTMGRLPQTPRARKVIEYAIKEARSLKHAYVGTEHLLLGLLDHEESVAAQVLMNLGLNVEEVRGEVINLLGTGSPQPVSKQKTDKTVEDLPGAVRCAVAELDAQINQLTEEKETAIAEMDFVKAAHLRDQAVKLKRRRRVAFSEWAANHPLAEHRLSWNDGEVFQLARRISMAECWEALPLLAETLEKAGCTDQEILSHCRERGEHSTYCWVVDLLLNRCHWI